MDNFHSVWRPLFSPIEDHPLVMCDSRTVRAEELFTVDLIFPHYISELYKLIYNPDQKWYYVEYQMSDEVWLMKTKTRPLICRTLVE